MKIFSWMQSKLNGKQRTKKPNSKSDNDQTLQEPCKEEFSDWPHGLLAIGTFGNKSLDGDPERCNLQGSQSSSQGQPLDITPEEAVELQKELVLLHTQVSNESSAAEDLENLQLEMLTFTPSLEDESSKGNTVCGASAGQSGQLQRSTSLKGKDICLDHTKKSMRKKALSFLLKKIGISQSMFAPTPSLRDPIPDKSTMEKILRAILHKKVYPQNSSTKATTKKYLDTSHMHKPDEEDETDDTANDGSKWVKTDSEYIVLEI
ncbi:protein NEGATIVE GRAVITROPIC RESPONSE OF ROOTS [Rhododendron vialii]|uniref:protein NEGATIVE GRAVITROPIC RESPONSE OF ROOTS n=1 Tax=Rhododendron vialii TaxID=182163 RepID=UPI00265DE29E|nr:protein NEGATIVE GRAVITROPIC RESPONSE OF ROOTS [Rhododendron vialii]